MLHLDPTLSEWLNLLLRWIHVFAGIMWVGTTYYFTWLDARLTEEEKAAANTGVPAQIWMVHSGGFYVVEKRKVPDLVSRTLHWFKFEAGTTWLSGFALLIVVYYLGGGALVDPDVREISVGAAVGIGVGVIILGWIVYDLLVLSPLGRNEVVFAVIAYALIVGLTYGANSSTQRARRLHSRWRTLRNHHGCKCVDADSASTTENDCSAQRRSKAGRSLVSPGETAFETKHVPGGAGSLHHDQQSLSRRDLRRSL